MNGQMMSGPLLISSLITHAARHSGDVPIVSRRIEGDIHRTTYSQLHDRARQMAHALVAGATPKNPSMSSPKNTASAASPLGMAANR